MAENRRVHSDPRPHRSVFIYVSQSIYRAGGLGLRPVYMYGLRLYYCMTLISLCCANTEIIESLVHWQVPVRLVMAHCSKDQEKPSHSVLRKQSKPPLYHIIYWLASIYHFITE